MRRPLEVLAVGVVLGELLCLAGIRGILLFLLCLCPALLAFFWRGVRRRILLVLVLGAVAGALRLQLALLPGRAERQLQRAEGAAATFRGRIAEIEPRGELTRVRCGSVYLLLRESDGGRLALGRVLTASGNLSPIAAPTNPGEFDYRAYCRARGVTHRMQVRRYRVEGRASPLAEGLRRFRSVALERLRAVCPEQEAGYLAALLLGDKHALSEDFYDLYRKNGIAHLLAISGLHTG
ncbi:MAG: ComEC/Rec2 family competence protein, partial [Stomatobaculum longum]